MTNEEGFFQAPYLIPGAYRITVELTGFKKLVREGDPGQRRRPAAAASWRSKSACTTESVTVTAESPLLETTNASLGQVVDARRVAELPIPHGDPYALIGLAAGVSFMRSVRLDRPFEPTHIVGYAMNGVRSNRSDVTIDGLPSTSTANAGEVTASFVPPQGLVQEFKVQTATFDASLRQHRRGRDQPRAQVRHQQARGRAVLRQDAEGARGRTTSSRTRTTSRSPTSGTRDGPAVAGGPVLLPGHLRRPEQDVLHLRLRNAARSEAAQQRRADGPEREDAQRRLLGAARARVSIPDLQPVHAPRRSPAAASSRIRSRATSSRAS